MSHRAGLQLEGVSSVVLDLAKELYRNECERGNALRAKGDAILGVSRILIPTLLALGAFVSPMLVVIPLVILSFSLILLVELHRPQWDASPAIDEELLSVTGAAQDVVLADSYMRAARTIGGSNDFLASLLGAAHRVFGLGLAVTILWPLVAVLIFSGLSAPRDREQPLSVSVEIGNETLDVLKRGQPSLP